VLGAPGESPYLIKERSLNVTEQVRGSFAGVLAFYLYVTLAGEAMAIYMAYAEERTAEAERGTKRMTMRGVSRKLWQAAPLVPYIGSNELVRDHFELVFLSAALAIVLEDGVP
jgi:hypothetical protein